MENICRLCQSRQTQSLESIFDFENGRLVADLITIVCPIRIDANDNLPKRICEECMEVIISANKLRETSVKSDINFRQGNFRIPPVMKVPIVIEDGEEIVFDDPLSPFQSFSDNEAKPKMTIPFEKRKGAAKHFRFECPYCDQTFSYSTNVTRHVLRCHKGEDLKFPCLLCNFRFKNQRKLNNHTDKHHRSGTPKTSSNTFVQQKSQSLHVGSYQCDFCRQSFVEKFKLTSHLKKHHIKQPTQIARIPKQDGFPCLICGFKFQFKISLEKHVASSHR